MAEQQYRLRRDERHARKTPQDEEVINTLVARMNQGDTYGYFELLELYPKAKYRQRIREIINDPLLSFEQRRQRVNWEELKAKDPKRFVRLALINLGIRAGHGRDIRDDWAAIEFTAIYAREHHVNAGPILDEVAGLFPFLESELKKRWGNLR